ncbi:MAG: hypothetical protein KIS81_05320 [Maricaulaceae bacterium]|nr:hypothetical protein [Maricaulaceae bacterium]
MAGIRLTLWSEISGGSWTIEAGTPQAERLLEVCRRVAPDPFEVRALIEELASNGVDAPPLPPRPRHAGPPPPDAETGAAGTGAAEPEAGDQPDAAPEDGAA